MATTIKVKNDAGQLVDITDTVEKPILLSHDNNEFKAFINGEWTTNFETTFEGRITNTNVNDDINMGNIAFSMIVKISGSGIRTPTNNTSGGVVTRDVEDSYIRTVFSLS